MLRLISLIVCQLSPLRLDTEAVLSRSREQLAELQVAQGHLAEVRAQRVGAGAWSTSNPDISVTVGPGYLEAARPSVEYMVTLTWPLDVSNAAGWRTDLAAARGRQAEAELENVARLAMGDALDLFLRAQAADARVELEQARVALDADLVRISEVRRQAGAAGDADVALALVMRAEGSARLHYAVGEREALTAQLRGRLAVPPEQPVSLAPPAYAEPPPLPELLPRLETRADLRSAALAEQAAAADATLQHRVGWPVPKIILGGGRNPESILEAGLDVPLPVYQRNQTVAAEAEARQQTAGAEHTAVARRAEAELRANYASYTGAAGAREALRAALPAMADAEHLAMRAYELGQDSLARAVVARREAVNARAALVDADLALARARVAVDVAAGLLP